MVVMLWTLTRNGSVETQEPLAGDHLAPEKMESKLKRVVTGATALTVLLLFALLIASVTTGKATADLGKKGNLLTIEVTGNQWWWQFRYLNDDPSRTLTTANEIHIPVGRTVLIQGKSNDVIHSFWVPNLHGKRDLIPSRVTTEYIQADKPGIYRGQCAEFCGLQHAHMSFWVIAEPEAQFNTWLESQLQPAAVSANPVLQQGQQNFANYECIYCHQIRARRQALKTRQISRISDRAEALPRALCRIRPVISRAGSSTPRASNRATTWLPSRSNRKICSR